MKTFLLEIVFADGSCKYTNVGAQWHDEFLKALKNKRAVLVRAWSSTRGVIKRAVVNRKKYAELMNAWKNQAMPDVDEVSRGKVEVDSSDDAEASGDVE